MTFVIAEAGVNHSGDLNTAKALIQAAEDAGADAVKFQLYSAELLEPAGARRDMLKDLELTREQHVELKGYAEQLGIQYLCTPFDVDSCRFLIGLGLRQIKIASGNLDNDLLLQAASEASTVILSTGAADLNQIRGAAKFIQTQPRPNGGGLIVLHCCSAYPAPIQDINLKAINALRSELPHCSIGYSDHSEGISIAIAAAALGAVMIEKHITLDNKAEGPDHAASLEPDEFKAMVDGIRAIDVAMGNGFKRVMPSEGPALAIMQARTEHREQLLAAKILAEKEAAAVKAAVEATTEPEAVSET